MRKQIKTITCNSLFEANKKIYELLIQQYLPKEITQIEFIIQGVSRHYNLSQISKIKKEFEYKKIEEDESKDLRTAFFFKQFDKGKTVKDVVKETGYKLEKVKKAFDEFLELEEKKIIPKWFFDDLKENYTRFERRYEPNFVFDDSKTGFLDIATAFSVFVDNDENS